MEPPLYTMEDTSDLSQSGVLGGFGNLSTVWEPLDTIGSAHLKSSAGFQTIRSTGLLPTMPLQDIACSISDASLLKRAPQHVPCAPHHGHAAGLDLDLDANAPKVEKANASRSDARVADRLLDSLWCPTKLTAPPGDFEPTLVSTVPERELKEENAPARLERRQPRRGAELAFQRELIAPLRTLREWLQDPKRPRDVDTCMCLFWQVFQLIDAARTHGVLERPMRPSLFALNDDRIVTIDNKALMQNQMHPQHGSFASSRHTSDLQEQHWYTPPGGTCEVSTAQGDSFSLGVLLYDLAFPCTADSRDMVMTGLHRCDIEPELMKKRPNEAAAILWLLRSRPPFAEILRSDLFKINNSTNELAEATVIDPKLAHSELLKDFLEQVLVSESQEHSRLVQETNELNMDIAEVEAQLKGLRASKLAGSRPTSSGPLERSDSLGKRMHNADYDQDPERRDTYSGKRLQTAEHEDQFDRRATYDGGGGGGKRRQATMADYELEVEPSSAQNAEFIAKAMRRISTDFNRFVNVFFQHKTESANDLRKSYDVQMSKSSIGSIPPGHRESLGMQSSKGSIGSKSRESLQQMCKSSIGSGSRDSLATQCEEWRMSQEHGVFRASMQNTVPVGLGYVCEPVPTEHHNRRRHLLSASARASFGPHMEDRTFAPVIMDRPSTDHPMTMDQERPLRRRTTDRGGPDIGPSQLMSMDEYRHSLELDQRRRAERGPDERGPSDELVPSCSGSEWNAGVNQLGECCPSMADLDGSIRRSDAEGRRHYLEQFGKTLSSFTRYSKWEVLGEVKNNFQAASVDMVCSAAFDRDDEFFATVGVSKRIKVFEYSKILDPDLDVHCPVTEMTNRAKLSSVCWSSYIKSHLASSDYEGTVTLWDAANSTPLVDFEEHKKRVWAVDIATTNPNLLLSGSDDGTVKLWHTAQDASTATIQGKPNVCCVQFSPTNTNLIAFGSADYKSYVYDLRWLKAPLMVLCCHSKAVSYVRFLGENQLISASTDNTLKLWDLDTADAGNVEGRYPGTGPTKSLTPKLTYRGHVNERNFVGLSLSEDGYIACGSEDNSVYAYHHSLPWHVAKQQFDPCAHKDTARQFVSTVCWTRKGNTLLAANSSGQVKFCALKE